MILIYYISGETLANIRYSPFEDPLTKLDDPSKNPYSNKISSQKFVYYGDEIKTKKGKWRQDLSSESLIVELGCHKGRTLKEMAIDHSDIGFVGIDRTFKRVVQSAEKAENINVENVRVCLVDGLYLTDIFDKNEVDGFICFFPDPWPKKKHEKNRLLIQDHFIKAIQDIIKPDGHFWFKTDSLDYFNRVVKIVEQNGFVDTNKKTLFEKDYTSTFEQKFLKLSLPTYTKLFRNNKKF